MTSRRMTVGACLTILAAVAFIYHDAAFSYFFNDDFHWLAQTRRFEPGNLVRLDRYDHFYRPAIELYFLLGLRLFGCAALPFHLSSIGIHLLCTLVLFLFARTLTGHAAYAFLAALFFSTQPGHVEAVTWVGAITDLLPALWYLLALLMHLRFLQRGGTRPYVASLLFFALCLMTHESSATLLPMMIALEMAVAPAGGLPSRQRAVGRHAARYVPFALLLAASLLIAYIVNTRSYLVREGYYSFGWHAIPNVLDYIVSLYVGKHRLRSYVLVLAVVLVLLVKGSARVRLAVLWILVTLAPASFFTWGNASRYLYLPAAGFGLLLADLVIQAHAAAVARWKAPRAAQAVAVAGVAIVTLRFAAFANEGADGFRDRTRPYERLLAEIRRTGQVATNDDVIVVDARYLEGVPEIYRDAAAETALCRAGVRLAAR